MNRALDGQPALVRNDKEIDFNWGSGAVAVGLSRDDFSARWSRTVTFERGVYWFQARADDGVRVYVDDKPVLDEWHTSSGGEPYSVDLKLTGRKALVVEYHERTGEARMVFSWKRVGNWPTPMPTVTPAPRPTATPTSTSTPTSTPTPTPMPMPTATPTSTVTLTPMPTIEPMTITVRLNEIMPATAQDGAVDEGDEWIELYNEGPLAADLSGWFLDDGPGGSEPYQMPEGLMLEPGAFALFRGSVAGIVLEDAGDEVQWMDPNRITVDVVAFGELALNASYSRDEFGVWHNDWPPSPGGPNLPLGSASDASVEWLGVRAAGFAPRSREMESTSLWIR